MATYAIGDIQGCYQSFRKLLKKIKFNPLTDKLWLAGDMINRGQDSLQTMQFILDNQQHIQSVLGNHDLHFLAVAHNCQEIHAKDTFDDILNSDLKQEVVAWLSKQPLALYNKSFDTLMVHAGMPFNWSKKQTLKYSQEVSKKIQSASRYQFYLSMYGNLPDTWQRELTGHNRLRYITNALTRMRYCHPDGRLELKVKSSPGEQNSHLIPWFELENQQYQGSIIFGHWASLEGRSGFDNIHALDTGCVWGGRLTAFRLEDNKRFYVNFVES